MPAPKFQIIYPYSDDPKYNLDVASELEWVRDNEDLPENASMDEMLKDLDSDKRSGKYHVTLIPEPFWNRLENPKHEIFQKILSSEEEWFNAISAWMNKCLYDYDPVYPEFEDSEENWDINNPEMRMQMFNVAYAALPYAYEREALEKNKLPEWNVFWDGIFELATKWIVKQPFGCADAFDAMRCGDGEDIFIGEQDVVNLRKWRNNVGFYKMVNVFVQKFGDRYEISPSSHFEKVAREALGKKWQAHNAWVASFSGMEDVNEELKRMGI